MPGIEAAADAWRPLAWQFQCLPSVYCDESWLPKGLSDAQLPSRADARSACHRYLSPWLSRQLNLPGAGVEALADPLRRLALLDASSLERLQPPLGLLLCAPALRRIIDGAVLERLRAACGLPELGFLVAGPATPMMSGAGWTMQVDLAGEQATEALPVLGRQLLMDLAGAGHDGVARRLRLKFPRRRKAARLTVPPLQPDERNALAAWLPAQLLPRVLPSWAWLFS